MWRILFLVNLLLLLTSTAAHATVYNVRFCVEVTVDLIDPGVGDRWTVDGENKPARGFSYSVAEQFDPTAVVSMGNLFEAGPYVGCTPEMPLSDTLDYELSVLSTSDIGGNSISVEDTDLVNLYEEVEINLYTPSASRTEIVVIDGAVLPEFNHLAIASFALYLHDAGISRSYFIQQDGCCWWEPNAIYPTMHVDGATRSKTTITHLLGHLIAGERDLDANGVDQPPDMATGVAVESCDGSDETDTVGLLTKEWNSAAAVEGFADFYSDISWNVVTSEYDCENAQPYRLDWENDFIWNTSAHAPYTCEGDPNGGTDYVTAKDWLKDLVDAADPGLCTGDLYNRSTEYDWERFWWDVATDGDNINPVPIATIWQIWDDADPHDWDTNRSTIQFDDDPEFRVIFGFSENSVSDAFTEQESNVGITTH